MEEKFKDKLPKIIYKNKKKVGLFKDESTNNLIQEVVSLRAKVYVYKTKKMITMKAKDLRVLKNV